MAKDLEIWQEKTTTGEVVGKDPRRMTQDEFRAVGHAPMSPIEAIRARCLDCCAGSHNEVRYCTARKCPSWPFRMGRSPWREKKVLSEEQRASMAENLARARESKRVVAPAPAGEPDVEW